MSAPQIHFQMEDKFTRTCFAFNFVNIIDLYSYQIAERLISFISLLTSINDGKCSG